MRRLEEKAGLPPTSPLRSFVDPYVEYDNLSGQQFDDEEQHVTEDFQEFEQRQGFQQPSVPLIPPMVVVFLWAPRVALLIRTSSVV
jgi:hypothetical protein